MSAAHSFPIPLISPAVPCRRILLCRKPLARRVVRKKTYVEHDEIKTPFAREFWRRGYYVDTAGKNDKKIAEYIRHQLEEDQAGKQLTMGNF